MSKLHDQSYLLDILDSAEQIKLFTESITVEEFEKDTKCCLAVQRLFEIIGEATKNLSTDFRNKNPQIDWKAMAGMRDVLIHQYHNANNDRLFKISRNNIPDLIQKIKALISQLPFPSATFLHHNFIRCLPVKTFHRAVINLKLNLPDRFVADVF